ncbi:DUF58 domain-containing protein [Oricola cellulosilytica]|uniref:DUF58 domain-containing protein n=1 Tax=Oricola cellulosilytica TaxID=1429082 RepID=A0A4R0PCZ8_9HYPH|nr:DUF58 domain-containing protein [Oricola cellulosilytica]TCD15351.1 DUF58 domain-containing protein [Oricola cellulosilytica]
MPAIGARHEPASTVDALARARLRAALVPDLLIEARRIVTTVVAGWHGRRKRGVGETFWQFRPYVAGETLARIDWRRSARDDHTYVRDMEWEAAHTVWLWADLTPSMLFKSTHAPVSKEARALVLTLALAELLSRSGERVGYPGLMKPVVSRNGAERLAMLLASSQAAQLPSLPELDSVQRHSDVVLVSDFLDPPEQTIAFLDTIARRGARIHLLEVADPAEEVFPYAGRTEFEDPENGLRLTAGRAENWADAYKTIYQGRREALRDHCRHLDWSYAVNRTDRLASEALVALHGRLTGRPAAVPGYRSMGAA